MRKIKDIVTKPSEALEAMVRGLINQSARPDFKVDMISYGSSQGDVCFGCAATCALQEIAGVNLNQKTINWEVDEIRCAALGFAPEDVDQFEQAINDARQFRFRLLFKYYGMDHAKLDHAHEFGFLLNTKTWREQLPKVQEFIDHIKAMGY